MVSFAGRSYTNPEVETGGTFEVVRSWSTTRAGYKEIGERTLQVMQHALADQIPDYMHAVYAVADPTNPALRKAQYRKLVAAAEGDRTSVQLHARFPATAGRTHQMADIIGVARAIFDDRRLGPKRDSPEAARNLMEIRGVYVDSRWSAASINLQKRGVASALLHMLASGEDRWMPTEAIDHSGINPTLVPVIEGLGYEPVHRHPSHFGGMATELTHYGNVNCGELTARLEERLPWLADWKPLPETA